MFILASLSYVLAGREIGKSFIYATLEVLAKYTHLSTNYFIKEPVTERPRKSAIYLLKLW